MSKQELEKLKADLYFQIEQLQDEAALHMLQEAATAYASPENDILDHLSDSQIERLNESIQQADNNQVVSNEEVKQQTKGWLSK